LGMVISHWSRPTEVLAELGSGLAADIPLPKTAAIVEPNHAHNRSKSRSNGLGMLAKLEGIASASATQDVGRSVNMDYSKTDHEVHFFSDPLSSQTGTAISKLPEVQKHMDSGWFGKRPVYLVSGLRIATSSFTVMSDDSSHLTLETEGSGPPTGVVPGEIGGHLSHNRQQTVTNTYDTSPNVVFAYRLHIIRPRRARLETGLFSHKSAFLTGKSAMNDETLVVAEFDKAEIETEIEGKVNYEVQEFGDESCVIRS
jgi:hypothetical protein